MSDKNEFDLLVIDDEQVIVDAVKRIAGGEGFKVDTAMSAPEALKKLEVNNYKLIITDIMMPEMDGFQLLEELEKRKITIPVIVTTGYSTFEMAVKSLLKGAIGYIPKPFTIDEVLSIIYRGIEHNNIEQEVRKEMFETSGDFGTSIPYVPCPPKYYRLGQNSWINVDNEGLVFIGATDLYFKTLKSFNEITLMSAEENLIQGQVCANFKTEEDLTHNLLSPLSGLIVEVNNKLIENSSLVEKDPYFEGWLYRIIPSNLEMELKNLITCSSDRI